MTPDDARKLLGGYATGSLTEAERTALFEAALEDQELFDELAGEQVLKEVLDEPGARQRLLVALGTARKEHRRGWMRPWPWAAATVAMAVVIGIVIFTRTPPPEPPQQIAQVMKSPEPVNAPAAPPAAEPPPVRQKVSPAPPPEPPAELKKEALADRLKEVKPQATEAARGFVAGAPAAAALRAQNETVTVTVGPVVFSYAIGADGFLQITTVESGFVIVSAEFTDRDVVVFPSTAVAARNAHPDSGPCRCDWICDRVFKNTRSQRLSYRASLSAWIRIDPDPPNRRFRIEVPATVITPPSLTPATR